MVKENKVRVQITMRKELKQKLDEVAKITKSTLSETIMTFVVAGLIAMSTDTKSKGEKA